MRILIVEITDSFLDSIGALLRERGFVVSRVAAHELARVTRADDHAAGAVIGAAGVEDRWFDAVGEVRLRCSWVVAGSVAATRATVGALRHGASDYFALPADLDSLVAWALELRHAAGAAERQRVSLPGLVGCSPAFLRAVRLLLRVVPDGRSSVLLLGETGTGKELFARALHEAGPRAGRPFVELNCAAIPATLLESELFGHEAGAFTDARQAKPGLFEAAHTGTFFLDEVGDLPLDMQAKLLRVLDYRRVRRLGALADQEVDVRLVAATHRDLHAAVAGGRFREDLLYRLNVIQLQLPPLRARREDILPLVRHFLAHFCREYGRPVPAITPAAAAALQRHPWPGNIRELRNAVERGLLLGEGRLDVADMLPEPRPLRDDESLLPFPATLEHIAARAAQLMVERHGGNKSTAAEALGVSRKRLYALLRSRAGEPAGAS